MKDLIIIGAGGFGSEVAWLVERINKVSPTWNILGFVDDDEEKQGTTFNNYNVIGKVEDIKKYPDAYVSCAVANAKVRKIIVEKLNDVKFATLIDPSAVVGSGKSIGEGSVICANSVLTVNFVLGKHCIINICSTVGHDAVLGDYVTVYPNVNISGFDNIGECVEIGTGTQIIQGKSVGSGTVIGAGAVVIKDLPEKCTAVGSPAKPIKFFD